MDMSRLREAREWFASVPEEKVNMGNWTRGFNPNGDNAEHSCMTAGCFWGWCAAYKPFRELGIELGGFGVPRYNGRLGEAGVAEFFGISFRDAYDLIYPSRYPSYVEDEPISVSKEDVLARLDQYIAKYEAA